MRTLELSRSEFGESASPINKKATTSASYRVIEQLLDNVSQGNVDLIEDETVGQAFHGVEKDRVLGTYNRLQRYSRQNNRLLDVRNQLGELSNDDLGALMQLVSRDGYNATSAHLLADRNQQNAYYGSDIFDRDLRREKYARDLVVEHELGEDLESTKTFYQNFKFFPTITPHPTKDKNDAGEWLYRQRIRIMDKFKPEQRASKLAENDLEVVSKRVTPDRKDDFTKETDDALASQREILEGTLNWIEDKQEAFDLVHGIGGIDFMADDMHMDIGTRRWQGGDADGKPIPAPQLFALRVKGARQGIDMYLEIMKGHPELKEQADFFRAVKKKMDAIDLEPLQKMKLTSEDPETFKAAKKQFADVFNTTQYKGQTAENGPALTRALMKDLREMAYSLLEHPATQEAGQAARRAFLMHKQVGIGVGRQEIRHNGEDYQKIFDNLFEYLQEKEIVEPFNRAEKFSGLDAKVQAVYLKRFMEGHDPKQVRDWLFEANNDADGNGWSREILERFDTIHSCYNHNRMGFAIIAEATPSSAVLQQVMADAFGIKNMTHCPLNEDEKTIRLAAESLGLYSEVFGAKNLLSKIDTAKNEDRSLPPLFFAVMDPQSDSQKQYGLNIRWLQRATDQELIDKAITPLLDQIKVGNLDDDQKAQLAEKLVPVLRKIGTGASSARGGFSPKIVPRLFLNALQDSGFELDDIDDGIKPVLKQMACFVSTTIQGRDVGMRMGTSEAVQDLIEDVERECRAACLVIDGKLKGQSHLVVPDAPQYSTKMRSANEKAADIARKAYEKMRTAPSLSKNADDFNRTQLDVYMEKVGALTCAAHTNVGARPPAREAASKASDKEIQKASTVKARAIGSNNAIATSEAHFDGSFTMGVHLTALRDLYKDGAIDLRDIDQLKNDPFYIQQMMPNAMVALASADYEHGFDALSNGEGDQWTVERIVEAKKNNWEGLDESTRFHAVLAYDALMATAGMEALQDGPTLIRGRQTIRKIFGRAVKNAIPRCGFELTDEEMIYRVYNKGDRVNELKFGKKTKALFPEIDNLLDQKEKTRLSRAIVHEAERRVDMMDTDKGNKQRIDPKSPKGKSFLYHIACASRTMGPKNMQSLMGHWSFGARPAPVFEHILSNDPTLAKDVALRMSNPANDNHGYDRALSA